VARKLIRTEIGIDASPERVWERLTDFDSFPAWNPFIRRARGRLEPGEELDIRLRLARRLTVPFRPRVTAVVPGRELRWLARLGAPHVFDVERSFVIEPRAQGGVRFVQSELCTGVLTPVLFAGPLQAWLYRGYDALNLAIRAQAEMGGAAPVDPDAAAAAR
jgi:hypothetical protein